MAERQIGHRKSSLVFSARFPVVKWRSRAVAKSAYYLYVIYARKFYVRSHGKITRQSQPLTQYNIQKWSINWIETEDIELNNYMCVFPFSGEFRERDSSVYVLVLDIYPGWRAVLHACNTALTLQSDWGLLFISNITRYNFHLSPFFLFSLYIKAICLLYFAVKV